MSGDLPPPDAASSARCTAPSAVESRDPARSPRKPRKAGSGHRGWPCTRSDWRTTMTTSDFKDRAQAIASRPLDDVQRLIAHLALSLDDHIATVTGGDPAKVIDALRQLGMDQTADLLAAAGSTDEE